jgi:hypothetical protein
MLQLKPTLGTVSPGQHCRHLQLPAVAPAHATSLKATNSMVRYSSNSGSETASEEEADETVRRLHRLNSIQKGYIDTPKDGKSICCWAGKHRDGLPKHHTSR